MFKKFVMGNEFIIFTKRMFFMLKLSSINYLDFLLVIYVIKYIGTELIQTVDYTYKLRDSTSYRLI